jgi:hypothetical protein
MKILIELLELVAIVLTFFTILIGGTLGFFAVLGNLLR